MSNWKLIMPTTATNMVLNPSAEIATPANYTNIGGATITRDTTVARFGDYSYKIVPGAVSRGIQMTTAALANAIHYVTFYVYGTITGTLSVALDGGTLNTAAIIGGSSGGWVRYGASISAAQSNGSVATRLSNSANETWYVDAIQVEQSSYFTTYIDGGRGDSPTYGENTGSLYYWLGHRHASASWRDAQERGGGRIRDLEDDYGLKVQQTPGAGMPPLRHNQQALALQPGATFQSTKVLPRQLTLVAEMHDDTYPGYHSERKALIDLMKPDAVRGAQAFTLGYSGANSGKTVYCRFRYVDGLGMGDVSGGSMFLENQMPILLEAVSPFWIEDNRETATLSFVQTLTSVNRVLGRVNGLWTKLGTGFNGICYCSAYDPTTGRIYFGGAFTTANGVTVNRICYWNPVTATFTAMDSGVNNDVRAIAVAPNGDIWIGGTFTTVGAGATASKGLAKWVLASSSWTVPTATMTGTVSIRALVMDGYGNLYGGGEFLTIAGVANTARIFKYSAAGAFTALGTGMDNNVYALALDRGQRIGSLTGTDKLYVGGDLTTGNGVSLNRIGYWNGATFVAMGGGLDSTVNSIAIAANRNVYAGGGFTGSLTPVVSMAGVGMWNGTGWERLSSGITGTLAQVYTVYFGLDGLLYVSGFYDTIGPFTTHWPAVWNGSSWQLLDLDSTGAAPTVWTFVVLPNGDLYEGDDTASTRIVGSPTSNIVSTNTLAVYPNFTIKGPTSLTMTLQEITNLSSNQTMRFNLVVNLGEEIKISLQPGAKRVFSTWSGVLPGQPLPTSDFANFILQPTRADGAATNTFNVFVTGTTTGAVFLCHWDVAHWSVDGAAV